MLMRNKNKHNLHQIFPVFLLQPKMGIEPEEGSYNGGRIRCRFTRLTSINDAEYADFPLTAVPYHIMMARGPAFRGKTSAADKNE